MTPGAVFERVYARLKDHLREGRFRPGERLEPATLASDLLSSVTPVRDALHRLVGERLVDAPRQNGFRVPLLTEMGLRQLYAWHAELLTIAAARAALPLPPNPNSSGTPVDAVVDATRLFLVLGEATRSSEMIHALRAATDRLMPFRLREEEVLGPCNAEMEALLAAAEAADRARLRRSLGSYHRRRQRAVPELVALMLTGSPNNRSTPAV